MFGGGRAGWDSGSDCQQCWRVKQNFGLSPRYSPHIEQYFSQRYTLLILCLRDQTKTIVLTELEPSKGELDVLFKIIQLDIQKIQEYVKGLRNTNGLFEEIIPELESRLLDASPDYVSSSVQHSLDWFKTIFLIRELPETPGPDILLRFIRWAQDAKKEHLGFLKLAFSNKDQSLPRWVGIILKLGRYGVAARALVQTASEFPSSFNPMVVESISAPAKVQVRIGESETPLTSVLRRMPEIKAEEVIPRLAGIWNTHNAEAHIRNLCSLDLVTHAELQMVNFYDHNPHLKPHFRFIGVSKKSCFLCSAFLVAHPDRYGISSCHQKLYLSWIPPPAMEVQVYKQYKAITLEMSKMMEGIARSDLVGRLGSKRFPIPADSTAGVSLTGLTDRRSYGSSIATGLEDPNEFGVDLTSTIGDSRSTTRTNTPGRHVFPHGASAAELAELMAPGPDPRTVSASDIDLSDSRRRSPLLNYLVSLSCMVLHFRYQGEESRQDIVTIDSILDLDTHLPSWSKLVEFLNPDDSLGLIFKDTDVLVVNDHIRVRNERQFLACLQYLLNSGILNSEVLICNRGS
jgi:hypothetical protein